MFDHFISSDSRGLPYLSLLEELNKKELVQLPFSREYSTSNLVLFGFRLLKQIKFSSMGI